MVQIEIASLFWMNVFEGDISKMGGDGNYTALKHAFSPLSGYPEGQRVMPPTTPSVANIRRSVSRRTMNSKGTVMRTRSPQHVDYAALAEHITAFPRYHR